MFGTDMLALEALATEANATKVRGYEICCQFYCNTSFTVLFIHYMCVCLYIHVCIHRYTNTQSGFFNVLLLMMTSWSSMAGCFISWKLRTMYKNTFNKTIPS